MDDTAVYTYIITDITVYSLFSSCHVSMYPPHCQVPLAAIWKLHMRCDQHPGCLCYEGDDTTQLYEDFDIPVIVGDPYQSNPI